MIKKRGQISKEAIIWILLAVFAVLIGLIIIANTGQSSINAIKNFNWFR